VVQPGDTFYLIAQRFNITLESLLAANPGVDPYQLQVGQEIIIPVPPPPPPPAGPVSRYVSGYYAVDYWGDNRSYNSLKTYGKMINGVVTFCFLVDGYGNVSGSTPKDGVSLALSLGATPIALIHNFRNGSFNAADAHTLLTSSANRQRLIQNVITILQRDGYKGVNIDLENIPYYDRAYYTALVREFKAALEPLGYLTTVSVAAKTSDAPISAWAGAFDYAAIGTHADWVGIMTYDEHWAGGTPGPVASIGWVENVVKYAVTVIPRKKILMGIATYGYDWTAAGCQILTYQSVNQLIKTNGIQPLWHSTYGVPYFTYYKSGVRHEVWYENADAARLKFDLVNRYGLLGITIWRLGFEDGTFWEAVAEKL
jgi:spore germination protein YaaH